MQIFSLYKKKRWLKQQNMLDLIPIHIAEYDFFDNMVIIRKKRFPFQFLNKLIQKQPYYNIKLEKIGSEVWLKINGLHTIQQICDQICQDQFDENFIQRVCMFIQLLYEKKLIDFIIPWH